MKKIYMISVLILTAFTTVSCQSKKLIMYFPQIKGDSIISTLQQQNAYYVRASKNQLPDDIAKKYFFAKEKDEVGFEDGFNVDENKYQTVKYIKKVCPLFYQKIESSILLYYGIESCIYISFYEPNLDSITKTTKVSDFSDELGNLVTHSIINPDGYIYTVQIGENTLYSIKKIDLKNHDFTSIKDSTSSDTEKNIEEALNEAQNFQKM